jgi:acetylornithine deacetylase/succinyl-diaminopimelate desuccinylase-like protein
MVIGRHVPAGMIFVPSRGGISHSPEEHTVPDDVDAGMRVLTSEDSAATSRRGRSTSG